MTSIEELERLAERIRKLLRMEQRDADEMAREPIIGFIEGALPIIRELQAQVERADRVIQALKANQESSPPDSGLKSAALEDFISMKAENEALKHDVERQAAALTEHATENVKLREALEWVKDTHENCPDLPADPTSLPRQTLDVVRAALQGDSNAD